VAIIGHLNLNRAVDGDVVAVRILDGAGNETSKVWLGFRDRYMASWSLARGLVLHVRGVGLMPVHMYEWPSSISSLVFVHKMRDMSRIVRLHLSAIACPI
jgi:hypothetical protein